MKKLSVVFLAMALGITVFWLITPKSNGNSIGTIFIGNHLAYDVGPGPDVINTNVVAYEESSQLSNLLAAVVGPGPTLIANNIG